jgi:xanthine dehydrogenase molybdopterin-binding subunit B
LPGRLKCGRGCKRQLLEVAAQEFGVKAEEMIKNKKAFVKAKPEMGIPWARLVRMACYTTPGMVIIGRGQSSRGVTAMGLADYGKGEGDVGTNYSFTAQAQEVEVDLETGVVKCTDNSVIAHDCGFPLNPLAVDTQVVGGAYHPGVGAALYCEFKMDKGLTLNPNLVDYKLPRAYEAPMTEVIHVITNDPFGPFGAKEASEGSTCTAPPAIINAIHDATGVWIKDLPAKPEKVFWALKEKEEKIREVEQNQTIKEVHPMGKRTYLFLLVIGLFIGLLAIALMSTGVNAQTKTITLKGVTGFPKTHIINDYMPEFIESVSKRTQGRLNINWLGGPEVFPRLTRFMP